MNNKGFAISGIVYSVLILFLLLIFAILGILGSRKMMLDKLKNEVISELNNEHLNNIYMDNSGANYPRLVDNMIPVLYDNETNSWVYADIYEKWYDYDEKMWANAVILKNGVTKTVGQTISEDDIALMYVWIPRFKYVMFNAYNESVEEQVINVIFENDTNTTGTVKCTSAINQTDEDGNLISEICTDITNTNIINDVSTYTHPAFTFGDDEIEGFWVGKFENSTTDFECLNNASSDTCNKDSHVIEIKGNVSSLRYINISNMFTSIQNINKNYGITNADSHMIKNMEWGAVAYLKQSKYGIGITDIGINNFESYVTGCGDLAKQEVTIVCNQYNTAKGMHASTTNNIYGVYDMSGGAWEYTMGNMANTEGSLYVSKADFIDPLEFKYYDLYSYDTNDLSHLRGKFGDATKETMKQMYFQPGAWYGNNANLPYQDFSWFIRSEGYSQSTTAGIFYFGRQNGLADVYYSSRSVLIKQ